MTPPKKTRFFFDIFPTFLRKSVLSDVAWWAQTQQILRFGAISAFPAGPAGLNQLIVLYNHIAYPNVVRMWLRDLVQKV